MKLLTKEQKEMKEKTSTKVNGQDLEQLLILIRIGGFTMFGVYFQTFQTTDFKHYLSQKKINANTLFPKLFS